MFGSPIIMSVFVLSLLLWCILLVLLSVFLHSRFFKNYFVFLCSGEARSTMAKSPHQNEPMAKQPSTSAWIANRPKKGPDYYKGLRDEYKAFISGHKPLLMHSVMEEVAARTISLLTADVKLRKFMAVSREAIEEGLKPLNIGAKVLSRRSKAPDGVHGHLIYFTWGAHVYH